ncbi:c-type cytochrome [Sinosporangium siamense]|uniref:Cytochrome c domain-containing protein n=1 Tax=Sinosporangium siamense TaxID=1367973 RepID=A0A919RJ18_9ACTN|nr:cytochrome c [Sinosporangium siamense]GII94538.1 hypothetical protein Ssi02_47690 [Sinosporangium siamense]
MSPAAMRLPAACALVFALAACGPALTTPGPVPYGRPERGQALINQYGCASCHTVPGVREADALVGPPLNSFARRGYIAGELVNNAGNLVRWIRHPQAVEPGTAMPDLGVTEQDARDIAAYLLTLE